MIETALEMLQGSNEDRTLALKLAVSAKINLAKLFVEDSKVTKGAKYFDLGNATCSVYFYSETSIVVRVDRKSLFQRLMPSKTLKEVLLKNNYYNPLRWEVNPQAKFPACRPTHADCPSLEWVLKDLFDEVD